MALIDESTRLNFMTMSALEFGADGVTCPVNHDQKNLDPKQIKLVEPKAP